MFFVWLLRLDFSNFHSSIAVLVLKQRGHNILFSSFTVQHHTCDLQKSLLKKIYHVIVSEFVFTLSAGWLELFFLYLLSSVIWILFLTCSRSSLLWRISKTSWRREIVLKLMFTLQPTRALDPTMEGPVLLPCSIRKWKYSMVMAKKNRGQDYCRFWLYYPQNMTKSHFSKSLNKFSSTCLLYTSRCV